jgi:hypothetical protein
MPDCARCSHPHEIHQHYRSNMTDDCAVRDCDCRTYKAPPGRLRRCLERWLR